MNYYWLSVDDDPNVNWVIFRANPHRTLRERYRYLACSACGRVNELDAIRSGIDSDVRIRSKFDYFTSDDGFKCVNNRGRDILERCGAKGLEFVSLPGGKHFVVLAQHRVEVRRRPLGKREEQVLDLDAIARDPNLIASARKAVLIESDACGMEFHGKCDACSRYVESLYWPKLRFMALPEDTSLVVAPDISFEKTWSSETRLLASEDIVRALQRAGLRGLEPLVAE
ncbi:MAG: hypothetical protein H6822_03900 [Planctomycetaceae bacterium]|nr:hypothetical protein [Planctomycetales bacterium]MCB9921300.1 hypothetical protein [Planctomycetaceae bacterium]